MKLENWLAGQKNYHHNSRELYAKKKENFVNINIIENSSGCFLQYKNNKKAFKQGKN